MSLKRPEDIICPQCGEVCGKEYPARFSLLDGGEPGFSEGIGENFVVDGAWHCSKECADKTRAENAPEEEP
jgi:hypothetical protein